MLTRLLWNPLLKSVFPKNLWICHCTVEKWGFSCINYETDSHDNVTKIWCKICCKFYSDQAASSQRKAVAKKCSDLFVKGTTAIEKNNANDHVKKSLVHQTAVLCLTEKQQCEKQSTAACSFQTNALLTELHARQHYFCIANIWIKFKKQLTKKFQTAHHIATKAKAFNYYEELVKFNKNVMDVNLWNAYLTRKAGAEIVKSKLDVKKGNWANQHIWHTIL